MRVQLKKFFISLCLVALSLCLCSCSLGRVETSGSNGSTQEQSTGAVGSENGSEKVTETSSGTGTTTSSNNQGGGNSSTQGGGNSSTQGGGNSSTQGGGNSSTQGGGTSSGGGVATGTSLVSYTAVSEGANVIWKDTNVSGAKAYYKKSSASAYTQADTQLIRSVGGNGRVDYLGLSAGSYDLKVTTGAGDVVEVKNISIAAYDRSGYAHFNYTKGVGAYKDDGTLKSGITVSYVTEATKNNLKSVIKSNSCVRILGQIATDTLNSSGSWEGKYSKISGLAYKDSGSEGIYYNMLDFEGLSNLTIEGVGSDAVLYQWGMTLKKCNSCEVRNLTFTDYAEDAMALEGNTSSPDGYSNFWIHNNVFNIGKNNYDKTSEGDKKFGDGATDLKGIKNATYSYNVYNNCKKTGLVGGGNSHKQYNITMHHNYYNATNSRTPLARMANIHMYNNYFYKAGSYCVSLRASSYLFSEANTVESCKTFRDKETGGTCKSFGDAFTSSATGTITQASSRTQTVSNNCSYGSTFDTDSSKFYYANGKTNVTYLTTAAQAKTDCKAAAGVNKANLGTGSTSSGSGSGTTPTTSSGTGNDTGSTTGDTTSSGGGSTVVDPPITADFTTVYSNDFESYSSDYTFGITEGSTPYADLSTSENCVKIVSGIDGKCAQLVDSSAVATNFAIPFSSSTSGVWRVAVTIKSDTQNGNWTLITVEGTNFVIRSDSSKELSYSTDGGSSLTGMGVSFTAGTEYTFIFTFDYSSKKVSVAINGTVKASDITFDGAAISGLSFITAQSASRTLYVDNVLVQSKAA